LYNRVRPITPEQAKRKVKGYLTPYVAMAFRPSEPVYDESERPVWRMAIYLHLRNHGQVATLENIAVDAVTGKVLPLSAAQILKVQDRANELTASLTMSFEENL
jgi:hypothetical protein